jgi:hypothetical protein
MRTIADTPELIATEMQNVYATYLGGGLRPPPIKLYMSRATRDAILPYVGCDDSYNVDVWDIPVRLAETYELGEFYYSWIPTP